MPNLLTCADIKTGHRTARPDGVYLFSRPGHGMKPGPCASHSPPSTECDAVRGVLRVQRRPEKSYTPSRERRRGGGDRRVAVGVAVSYTHLTLPTILLV